MVGRLRHPRDLGTPDDGRHRLHRACDSHGQDRARALPFMKTRARPDGPSPPGNFNRRKRMAREVAAASMKRTVPVPLQMTTTFLARARACALLVLGLAACAAGDSDGAPFNPDGTTADLDAITRAYRTPAVLSFAASRGHIDRALGAPTVTVATALATARSRGDFGVRARDFALHARAAAARTGEPRASDASRLPAAALGATFAWDTRQGRYVASSRPGAPADGARFLLYAIDAASGRPVRPLRQVGYLDIADSVAAGANVVRLRVISGTTTWLEYGVTAERTLARAVVGIRGYATNGVDRVTFAVSSDLALEDGPEAGRIDYRLAVPSRDVALQWTVALGGTSAADPLSLDLALSSADGSVLLEGSVAGGAGTLYALANNVPVSTVVLARTGMTLARPDGNQLDAPESRALRRVLGSVDEASHFSDLLLAPVASVM